MASGLRVLVPMKALDEAKSRLSADVPPPERRAAVLGMLERVVRASPSINPDLRFLFFQILWRVVPKRF